MRNTSFADNEVNIFKSMIGKQFDKFKCDPFLYSPMVYGLVGLYVGGETYRLTSLFETVNRFFVTDEIATFRLEQATDADIKTFMDDGELIENPIASRILAIDIVNDHQSLEHNGKISTLDCSVGLIFHLEDDLEISFEIKTWFSEMITVERGYSLIDKFTPIDDFLEEWDGCEGYRAKCSREIITIK